MITWTGCKELASLTDAELDEWRDRGVDGFVCMVGRLYGMGGSEDFNGRAGAALNRPRYKLQRDLREARMGERLRDRGMTAYLGAYLVNYYNRATPLAEWFDDAGWSDHVLPRMSELARAARSLGFAGIAFDQELYPQSHGKRTATWDWNYRGRKHRQSRVRAQARRRGRQLMGALARAYPGLELLAYGVELPGSWNEVVQKEVNDIDNALGPRLDVDFWDGLSGVRGYGAIRLLDATFYKTPHVGTWDSALQYEYNNLYAYLSRRWSRWELASSRVFVSPFSWINRGSGGAWEAARSPDYVEKQLAAFNKWGMGRTFANYSAGGLRTFDYRQYEAAMRSASTPGVVDRNPPGLTIAPSARRSKGRLALTGTTMDNLAVRLVRWTTDRGGHGVARLRWKVDSGGHRSGRTWHTVWSARIPLSRGPNRITVTVEDIKGLARTQSIDVTR